MLWVSFLDIQNVHVLYCIIGLTLNIDRSRSFIFYKINVWSKVCCRNFREISSLQGESEKMSPVTKCDTIAPNLEINEIRVLHIDPDVHGIGGSRNAGAMSAWKLRTSFAPTQGLHISGHVPSKYRYCNSHISSYEWKIWIITTRQLRVHVTLFFHIFHIHISLKQRKLISDNTFHKLLQDLVQ